jgi:uncharacterized membrane-anchored protein
MRNAGVVCAAMVVFGAAIAVADPGAPELQHEARVDAPEVEAPEEDLDLPHVKGPAKISLGNHTSIDLPEGFILLERATAQDVLRKGGNEVGGVVAVIGRRDAAWMMVVEYNGDGYVDDSDADELDAAELLASYQQGAQQQNVKLREMGAPELFVDDWSEKPHYDRATRRLVWGLSGHTPDSKVINHFTRILGRSGYLSLNLIDDPAKIEASKKDTAVLLDKASFDAGHRYEDFREGDRKSGLGLRGLVLGGAGVAVASKLGILAKILLALKKGAIVVLLAIGAFFKWIFGRRKQEPAVVTDDAGTGGS